jgi:DNA replication protein DnaC
MAELAEREVRSIADHMKSARFRPTKISQSSISPPARSTKPLSGPLHRCEFMDDAQNVILIGGPDTGKALVATGLGIQAIEHQRRKVRFFSTIELVNAFEQEKAKGKAGQIAEGLTKLDLVILDELGYLPFNA